MFPRPIEKVFNVQDLAKIIGLPLEPITGGLIVEDRRILPRRVKMTLPALTISVADADDFGSVKLVDLPDSNIAILGFELTGTLTKDGTGFITTTDLDLGVGTAAASASPLASAMINVVAKADYNSDVLAQTINLTMNDGVTAPLLVVDGASSALYLNAAAPTETSQDGSLVLSAGAEMWITYIDLGNETS